MRLPKIHCLLATVAIVAATALTSCNEDSTIGSSIIDKEVTIVVDSTFSITGRPVYTPKFDSRTLSQLAGSISAREYGDLSCSYVTQFMPALQLGIPDSIPTDQITDLYLRLHAKKGTLTGDSLLPQRISVYRLTKQITSGLADNAFDPEADGFCGPSDLLGSKSFTMASALKGSEMIIDVKMPPALAFELINKYRTDPAVFEWPQTFAKLFPGIFVKSTFGQGCIVNVGATEMTAFWKRKIKVTVIENGVGVTKDSLVTDSCTFLSSGPEVLSFNNIRMRPAQSVLDAVGRGECVMMSPAGYNVEIKFPAQQVLDRYWSADFNLSVINDLRFSIPVTEIKNDYGIQPAPQILMVLTKDLKAFFAGNKVPDAVTSFYATYNSETATYTFNSMRNYIIKLKNEGRTVKEEDMTFTLLPVAITTDNDAYTGEVVPNTCTPYTARPSMGILDLSRAKVRFEYSIQKID